MRTLLNLTRTNFLLTCNTIQLSRDSLECNQKGNRPLRVGAQEETREWRKGNLILTLTVLSDHSAIKVTTIEAI
jgi:hypothetical protein